MWRNEAIEGLRDCHHRSDLPTGRRGNLCWSPPQSCPESSSRREPPCRDHLWIANPRLRIQRQVHGDRVGLYGTSEAFCNPILRRLSWRETKLKREVAVKMTVPVLPRQYRDGYALRRLHRGLFPLLYHSQYEQLDRLGIVYGVKLHRRLVQEVAGMDCP